ncbi:TM1812 family CRISPR-associated protein [uncultured Selenomonas sp.]|uniref:TM1812 family CRISPR-associated protein n=1 Tax=uncultured Selenomonas sp. TaxID=159275 RepID=UPI0025D01972|nr:TM1812 family CRISPR-associated protein [uncultured Selenomonas sp.]
MKKHHVMLLFLSDVKTEQRADGSWRICETQYEGIGPTHVTNESAVRYLVQQEADGVSIRLEKLFVLASTLVRERNISCRVKKDPTAPEKPLVFDFVDANKKTWRHAEYFYHRIADVLPEGCVEEIAYDERQPLAAGKRYVLEMAKRVMQYVKSVQSVPGQEDDAIVLHADLTGGMRNVNMLLLAVVRLLQYSGIEIGHLMYSNFRSGIVEEAGDIYGMFDMVSGAEEFARFGSVETLLDYFGYDAEMARPQDVSPALHQLLRTMHDFSDEIRVCHYGSFRPAIARLQDGLQRFAEHIMAQDAEDFNDNLMAQLQTRIIRDYGPIMQHVEDDLRIIRWCIQHNYLQQAMTLFTERVPEMLFQSGILQWPEEMDEAFEDSFNENGGERTEAFYLLAEYCQPDARRKSARDRVVSKGTRAYKKAITGYAASVVRKEAPKRTLTEIDAELAQGALPLCVKQPERRARTLRLLAAWAKDPSPFAQQEKKSPDVRWIEEQYHAMFLEQQMWGGKKPKKEKEEAHPLMSKEAAEACWQQKYGEEPKGFKKWNQLKGQFLDHLDDEAAKALFSTVVDAKAYDRTEDLLDALDAGVVRCTVEEAKLTAILHRYYAVKQERNATNHAHVDTQEGMAEAIQREMREGLAVLQEAASCVPQDR